MVPDQVLLLIVRALAVLEFVMYTLPLVEKLRVLAASVWIGVPDCPMSPLPELRLTVFADTVPAVWVIVPVVSADNVAVPDVAFTFAARIIEPPLLVAVVKLKLLPEVIVAFTVMVPAAVSEKPVPVDAR